MPPRATAWVIFIHFFVLHSDQSLTPVHEKSVVGDVIQETLVDECL